MLAATGSTITAAIPSGLASKASRTDCSSLYWATSVCLTKSAGTPAESGTLVVSAAEPAFTSSPSLWP